MPVYIFGIVPHDLPMIWTRQVQAAQRIQAAQRGRQARQVYVTQARGPRALEDWRIFRGDSVIPKMFLMLIDYHVFFLIDFKIYRYR